LVGQYQPIAISSCLQMDFTFLKFVPRPISGSPGIAGTMDFKMIPVGESLVENVADIHRRGLRRQRNFQDECYAIGMLFPIIEVYEFKGLV
jgi:hypothetical protein